LKKIFIAILMAAPISVCLSELLNYITRTQNERLSYYDLYPFNIMDVIIYGLIYIPFYILLGIPTTLIIDFFCKRKQMSSRSYLYIFQFCLYLVSAVVVTFLFQQKHFSLEKLLYICIPVFTYFHILFLIRQGNTNKQVKST
jgi:hypothetical protein